MCIDRNVYRLKCQWIEMFKWIEMINDFRQKCLYGEMFIDKNVNMQQCLQKEMFIWRNVYRQKCLYGEMFIDKDVNMEKCLQIEMFI